MDQKIRMTQVRKENVVEDVIHSSVLVFIIYIEKIHSVTKIISVTETLN